MPRTLFKPVGHDTLVPIRCTASGREEFSTYEAYYRAREACRRGTAEFCLVIDQGQILARFESLGNGEVRQTEGKEIL